MMKKPGLHEQGYALEKRGAARSRRKEQSRRGVQQSADRCAGKVQKEGSTASEERELDLHKAPNQDNAGTGEKENEQDIRGTRP